MSSDLIINDSVVVGIQGVAVSDEVPTDGYVLTYNNSGDGYWGPKPVPTSGGLRKEYFTSSGTWTCPEGVTNILVIAAGGAGGGYNSSVGCGGGGSLQQTTCIFVTPGYTYDILIGAGGNGGIGSTGFDPTPPGEDGNSTILSYNSTILFSTIGAAGGSSTKFGNNISLGGFPIDNNIIRVIMQCVAGAGGNFDNFGNPMSGRPNYINTYSGGIPGTTAMPQKGGSGGGAGPQGNGGNGGNGSIGSNGTNGFSAAANTGAGGGMGGNHENGFVGGTGGNGGSGYMYILY